MDNFQYDTDTMKRPSAILICVLFLSVFCLPAFSQKKVEQNSLPPLKIGVLKGPTGLGLIHALSSVPSLPSGRSLSYQVIPSVDIMISKLGSAELDFAALPPNTAAKLYNGGLAYRLAAVTGNGMLSFITANPEIKNIADLRGRTISLSGQGAVPEYIFRLLLDKAGLDGNKDLSLNFRLPYPEAAASLIAGKITDAVLPEPFVTMALSANPFLRVPFDIQELYAQAGGSATYPISVLVVKSETALNRAEDCLAFLKIAKDSIEWVVAHPLDAGKAAEAAEFGMKAQVAALSIPRANFVYKNATMARADIEDLFKVLLSRDPASLGGRLPDDAFYAF